MKFSEIEIGKMYKLVDYSGIDTKSTREHRKRCIALGLLKGTLFKPIRVAPFGDPVQINVRGYQITMRKADFEDLVVVEV
jgi:ferrous iron transport protein A